MEYPVAAKRQLPARHRAWLAGKTAVAAWLLAYAIVTPPATSAVLGAFVWVWTSVGIAGVIASVLGMFIALRPGQTKRGRVIELAGIAIASAGPIVHAITMISITAPLLFSGEEWTGRIGPLLQSVAIFLLLRVRYVEVRDRIEGGR